MFWMLRNVSINQLTPNCNVCLFENQPVMYLIKTEILRMKNIMHIMIVVYILNYQSYLRIQKTKVQKIYSYKIIHFLRKRSFLSTLAPESPQLVWLRRYNWLPLWSNSGALLLQRQRTWPMSLYSRLRLRWLKTVTSRSECSPKR